MIKQRARAWLTRCVSAALLTFACGLVLCAPTLRAVAQDEGYAEEEPAFTVNAMMKLQGGLFVPLASSGFSPHHNVATNQTNQFDAPLPCDPVVTPRKYCTPRDHGQKPGSPSITRATLQLEAHWDLSSKIALHAIVRGTRSMQLAADEYAAVPRSLDRLPEESDAQLGARRRAYAKRWVQENEYNTFELREFYADLNFVDWLSLRIGRQQVAWGETGSFRLLDVVNPVNSVWHFGPLESFEDQRIPLWMLLTTLNIDKLAGYLELLYIPGLDRARDTVSTPLSMGGAWGAPYSNTPSTFRTAFKDFQYPGGSLNPDYMRYGARWKGEFSEEANYSLVYMYTHMQAPVLERVELRPGTPTDEVVADRALLTFPRQHIAGLSLEYTIPSPAAFTARFEGAFEPNRIYSQKTDNTGSNVNGVITYAPRGKRVVNYAVVLQRPTMVRWLNPTQNVLLLAQFQHTAVLGVDDVKDEDLVQVLGFQDWRIQKHAYTLVLHASTQYFRGIFVPRVTGAWLPNPYYQDSGFVTLDLGFRIGPHYRVNITATDFVGKNPYRDLGLFRDRDEVAASLTVLF